MMDDWKQKYVQLWCAVWQCLDGEFREDNDSHRKCVREANRQAMALARIRDIASNYHNISYERKDA